MKLDSKRLCRTTAAGLMCVVLAACGQLPTNTAIPPTATLMITATSVPTSTLVPTPVPTNTPQPTSTPLPTAAPLEISITAPAAVTQGSTLSLLVESSNPATVQATLGNLALAVWSSDGITHRALLGVSAIADLDTLPLSIIATDRDGQSVALSSNISVVGGSFESEYLDFDDDTAALLDPAYTVPEAELLREVYGTVSDMGLWNGVFEWPVPEWTPITSYFGTRRWYEDVFSSYHAGTDLGAESGTPVHACADGIVVLAETLYVRGNAVIVDHGQGVLTGYYHMSELSVEPGQTVQTGDQLGLVGTTGLSTGSHLHWELQINGTPVNVLEWTNTAF